MTKTIFVYFVLIVVLSRIGFSQELISNQADSLIIRGIRLSIEQSYPKALSIFRNMQKEMPDNPAGYFFHAAVLQTQMMDYEVYDQEKEFLSLVKKTIHLSRELLKGKQTDPWVYFFLGGGYGYLALYQGKQNKLLDAFHTSRSSIKALEKALDGDSTLYDLHFGLGTYKYYRSKLSRYFSWLPFVGDERAEGINMIRTAIANSRYSRYSAISGLCWICIKEEDYEEGFEIVKRALVEFPDSRIFLWCAARSTKELGLWREAAGYYEKILFSLKNENVLSPYNEMICRTNLYEIYSNLGKHEKAENECQKILKISLSTKEAKRLAKNFKENIRACRKFAEKNLPVDSPIMGEPN